MDRALWEKHLVQADEHVALAERNVEKQRRVLAELARDHHPTAMAARILAAYEDLLALHTSDRDRIKRDLEAESGRGLHPR
jgi:hypothetical protein